MINKEIISETDSVYNYMDGDMVLGYLEIRLVDGVIDIMNLFVNENNNEALRLYSKLGFKEINSRERYYGSDTAIIMEKVK